MNSPRFKNPPFPFPRNRPLGMMGREDTIHFMMMR